MLILMASATYAQCSQTKDIDMLVTASKLKNSGFVDGQIGRVTNDLNGDGKKRYHRVYVSEFNTTRYLRSIGMYV